MEIIFTVAVIVIIVAGKAKKDAWAIGAKQRAIDRGDAYYFDGEYNREIKTNHRCSIDRTLNRDRIVDFKTREVLKDLNKDKFIAINKELKNSNYKVMLARGFSCYGNIIEKEYEILVERDTKRPFVLSIENGIFSDIDTVYKIYYFKNNIPYIYNKTAKNVDLNNCRIVSKEEFDKLFLPYDYYVIRNEGYSRQLTDIKNACKKYGEEINYIEYFD